MMKVTPCMNGRMWLAGEKAKSKSMLDTEACGMSAFPPCPSQCACDASGTTYYDMYNKKWDPAAMALIDEKLHLWVPELIGSNDVSDVIFRKPFLRPDQDGRLLQSSVPFLFGWGGIAIMHLLHV
eukprot:scaffold90687_cov17-Tisochrysis_lutea.AAC.2